MSRTDLLKRYHLDAEFDKLFDRVGDFVAARRSQSGQAVAETAMVYAYQECEEGIADFDAGVKEFKSKRGRPRKEPKVVLGLTCWFCPCCEEWLQDQAFSKNKRNSNGLQSWCKACKVEDRRVRGW